ncbi:hypothetical protein AJ79_00994 [Helicocarpus griseus UAMH5409]|uniref:ABC transporter n=1 Tax=Helicocarpus griseus UAMH5409 TaxID=1447875 RepID=A0A2B7Y9B8_9EURO|nr:hypothetical protein AJ79_00994 [Helicocarpus griseus UAMH5409]
MGAEMSPSLQCQQIDNTLGPHASYCRGGFDFTLLFEESILTIAPLALLLFISPLRILYLVKKEKKVIGGPLLLSKIVAITIFSIFQLALVVLWSKEAAIKTRASVATAALNFIGSIVLAVLSYIEHIHSVKPSILLNSYVLCSLIFDAARTRTLWLMRDGQNIPILLTISLAIKAVILFLEAATKRKLLYRPFKAYPPEATSGLYSRGLFWWLNSLFLKGFRQLLLLDDLFELDKHLHSEYLRQILVPALEKVRQWKAHTLLSETLKAFKWPLLCGILPRLALIGFTFCQPFLIDRAVELSLQPVNNETTNAGYGLIGAYAIVYSGIALTTGQYQHHTFRAITMMRGGLVSLIYNKTASLGINAVEPGSSVTLMNTDMERISAGFQFTHDLWANLIEIALATYLLYLQLGPVCAIPLAVAILSIFASAILSGFVVQKQKLWLEAIERRIAVTTAMLGSMKSVKLCGLSEPLSTSVQSLRVIELQISEGFRKLLIWALGFTYISPVGAPILTFTAFAVMVRQRNDDAVNTTRVFTSLSLFVLIATPLGSFIMALTSFMGAVGCFERIQTFLNIEKRVDSRIQALETTDKRGSEKSVKSTEEKVYSASNSITLGSKASSLPDCVNSVLPDGSVVSICNASFSWDKEKDPTLTDISMTINREKLTAIIGPVGCGKSTLLQAILGEVHVLGGTILVQPSEYAYCQQTPWLMNGTIQESILGVSNFDQKWYDAVIHACALEEDFRQLPRGDRSHIGSKGISLSGGQSQRIALARAVYAKKSIMVLDDVLRGLDADTENHIFNNLFGREGLLRKYPTTIIFTTSASNRLPYADHIVVLDNRGKIIEQGSFDDLNTIEGYVSSFTLSSAQWNSTAGEKNERTEERKESILHASDPMNTLDSSAAEASRRTGDTTIYLHYAKSVGRFLVILFAIALTLFAFTFTFPTMWVKWWAEANAERPNQRLDFYLGIYGMLGGASLLFLVISCWLVIITMVPKSGEFFHWTLLKKVIDAPMSFFSSTDTGVTLNRFSQDLQLIDMELPVAALNTSAAFIICIAQLVLIAVASKYAAIAFPFGLLAFYFIQKFYLFTSRQLRFMDIEAKAPLYEQFVELLSGLATVRAFGWESQLEQRNRKLLDISQKPFYLLWAVQRWLTVVLDLVVAATAVLLMILVVKLRGTMSAGYVGVALVNVITFNQGIKLLITYWTMLETHIGAIARVQNFKDNTPSENQPTECKEPPSDWPTNGAIEFRDVSAAYRISEPVLKNISLSIEAGQRIAICGRTGSGKSSMILAMFRMMEEMSGTITVDGLDISAIPRKDVRSRLICVPQDAYLFSGTVRQNVDPTGSASDEVIKGALTKVQLWEAINTEGGLDTEVNDTFLSHGQRQLFCLARALLRTSKVIVFDEGTSSVDEKTDDLIQRLICEEFKHRTIIMIAHKLDSILDFDKVAVLSGGLLVEFDSPQTLLATDSSAFYKLYNTYANN